MNSNKSFELLNCLFIGFYRFWQVRFDR